MGSELTCSWHDGGKRWVCGSPEWAVASLCPRCDARTGLLLCGRHYRVLAACAAGGVACCEGCWHRLSVMAQQIGADVTVEFLA